MFGTKSGPRLILGLVILISLAGCSPEPTPTAIPTIDPRPTMDAISTQAVQTAFADLTRNAPTATEVPPTATATLTNTPAPTETPAPSATPTRVFIPWTKTPTAETPNYACSVTGVSPKSTDTIKVNQDFDGSWSVKNTGLKTWAGGNVDAKYVSGTKFQTSGDAVDLSSDIAPNGTYTVTVDMKAPSGDGTYTTTWGIVFEDGTVCSLSMTINVSK